MAILKIYNDSRAPGTCRSCGAAIVWAQLITGKRMPFDAPLQIARVHPGGAGERAVADVDTELSYSHFVTCPDRDMWRRRK
jgi:hypothetical protein